MVAQGTNVTLRESGNCIAFAPGSAGLASAPVIAILLPTISSAVYASTG
jgi:hypothetical protein